ncbi:MAG: hypothetical protein JKY51_07425 [Opitutaceae bacterium]|nr:hypothetical protein [Opitutaceae bacterium]
MREVVEKVKMSHRRVSAKDFMMNNEIIKARIRTVRNWLKEGVKFRDVTTLFHEPEAFQLAVDQLAEHFVTQSGVSVTALCSFSEAE